MKKLSKYLAFVAIGLALSLSSCVESKTNNPNPDDPVEPTGKTEAELRAEFLAQSKVGLYDDGATLSVYSEENEQIAYSEDRSEYMVADLEGKKYYELAISGALLEGNDVTVSAKLGGYGDFEIAGDEMTVLRTQDELVWIWDSEKCQGAVLYFEE